LSKCVYYYDENIEVKPNKCIVLFCVEIEIEIDMLYNLLTADLQQLQKLENIYHYIKIHNIITIKYDMIYIEKKNLSSKNTRFGISS